MARSAIDDRVIAPRLSLIVFDLDGTLIDSRKDLAAGVNLMLAEFGVPPLPEPRVSQMVGEGARVLVERALAAAGVPIEETPRALERFLAIYEEHLLDRTRAYPGIPELLGELHRRTDLAVLTNKPARATTRILEGLQIDRFFRLVVGGDGGHARKPHPAALLHIIQACGATRETTMMVGDSRIDLETARNAGVRCCLVRYGFGFSFTPGELADAMVVETPQEITSAL